MAKSAVHIAVDRSLQRLRNLRGFDAGYEYGLRAQGDLPRRSRSGARTDQRLALNGGEQRLAVGHAAERGLNRCVAVAHVGHDHVEAAQAHVARFHEAF